MSGPPLKRLHPDATLEGSSLSYWRRQTSHKIIQSLRPESKEPLRVKDDGTVMDGNTRIKALEERGIDVDNLRRSPYVGGPSFNWEDGY